MQDWALILGSSSGFGAATCRELASRGIHIYGVHLDRRAGMDKVNILIEDWGGKYQCQEISAKSGEGIDGLLEKILLQLPDHLNFGMLLLKNTQLKLKCLHWISNKKTFQKFSIYFVQIKILLGDQSQSLTKRLSLNC